ncbi:MAG TPA: CcmD family protein [Bdellovibrionota bacterium]|nr:CcmD family protein [Bdellovibrionota bacterium]
MNHLSYLIAAYLVFWIATLAYLFSIDRRQRQFQRSIRQLSEKKPAA